MQFVMIAVRDDKAEAFLGKPTAAPTVEVAMRDFGDLVNARDGKENSVTRHPEDYSLWLLGRWDAGTGVITPEAAGKVHLACGIDLVEGA